MQGRGVGRMLTARFTARMILHTRGRAAYLLSRTQNPVIGAECAACIGGGRFYYPRMDGQPAAPDLRHMAETVASVVWPDKRFDGDTGVLLAAYGGPFLPTAPTRREAVAEYYERHVDCDRGDAIVQVIRLSPGAWIHVTRYFAANALRKLRRRLRGGTRARTRTTTRPPRSASR